MRPDARCGLVSVINPTLADSNAEYMRSVKNGPSMLLARLRLSHDDIPTLRHLGLRIPDEVNANLDV